MKIYKNEAIEAFSSEENLKQAVKNYKQEKKAYEKMLESIEEYKAEYEKYKAGEIEEAPDKSKTIIRPMPSFHDTIIKIAEDGEKYEFINRTEAEELEEEKAKANAERYKNDVTLWGEEVIKPQRNMLLSASDQILAKYNLEDFPAKEGKKDELLAYRDELRNIPNDLEEYDPDFQFPTFED